MNLYEIDARLANLLDVDDDIVDGDTGEIVSLEEVEALEMERAAKIEGWGLWIKNRRADIAAIEAEIKSQEERRKRLKNHMERSMERYRQYLAGEKVSTPRLSVSYRKNPGKLIVDDESKIPEDYIVTKEVREVDNGKVKDALKSGQEVPGAHIQYGVSMTIK